MPYKVYSSTKDSTGAKVLSLENICKSQLQAQCWVDAMNDTNEELFHYDLVKIQTIFESNERLLGHNEAERLKTACLTNVNQQTAYYLQETFKELIESVELEMYVFSHYKMILLKEMLKAFPEITDDIWI